MLLDRKVYVWHLNEKRDPHMADTKKDKERGQQRARLVWEEIMREPDIYRVYEVGSSLNCYLFLSGEEALVIDPRSEGMLRSVFRLVRMLGSGSGNVRVFFTQPCGGEICTAAVSSAAPDSENAADAANTANTANTINAANAANTANAANAANTANTALYVFEHFGRGALRESSMDFPDSTEQTEKAQAAPLRTRVQDGDIFRIGEKTLRAICLEGCQKGLCGLWFPEKNILFSGEAISRDDLPEVRSWDPNIDTLGLQIEVLRRVGKREPQCILPARGNHIGVDSPENEGKENCRKVLDAMLTQYCMRILEVYQKVPAREGIPAGRLFQEDELECGAGTESCLKYLLYRRYIRERETAEGCIYERGSLRLTDWSLQEKG